MSELSMGLYLPMAARGIATRTFLEQLVVEARTAEAAGLDVVLVPEHHVGPPESLGDPGSVAAWLLARTTTIRVGPGVLLLPLHHPTRVAEWSAFLQHASGNRLVLGVGTGYQQDDFDLFGVARDDRVADFDAGLERVRACWRGEGGTKVIPHLDRVDEPPVWIGAWSQEGLGRAGRAADAWLVDPMRRVDEIAAMAAAYRDVCESVGKTPEIAVIRELWVDDTDEAARRRYTPVVTPIIEYYRRNGALRGAVGTTEEMVAERVICGSVETVTDRIVDLVESTGASTVICTLRHPAGPAHTDVVQAITRLGTDVLPAARRALGAGKQIA